MTLTESMNRHQACNDTIVPHKPHRTKVAELQEGAMSSETPQVSCALLAADLQHRRLLVMYINRRRPQATWSHATTCLQGAAACSLSGLQRGILEVLGARALPGQDDHTSGMKVSPNEVQGRTMQRHRPAIHRFPGAGRHDLDGGYTHVLAVTGSAHSQAPPIPHTDGADRQDCDTRTTT
jgi:hypothetical protein